MNPLTLWAIPISLLIIAIGWYLVFLWAKKAVKDQDKKEMENKDRYPSATRKYPKEIDRLLEMDK